MKEHMPKVKAENPTMPQQEVMKKVAAMYRELRGEVNPAVPPSKSVAKASKELVSKSKYYTQTTTAVKSATKSASGSKTKSATKSASGSKTKSATKSKV